MPSDEYQVGHCKPPLESRWKPGQSGNPGGLTLEQAAKRKASRDKAAALEERMLDALKTAMDDNEKGIVDHIRADVLKLIHTAIEREDGKPTAHVDNTSSDGSMTLPSKIQLVGPDDDS